MTRRKHARYQQRIQQQTPQEAQHRPRKNQLLLGIGIAGIIIMAGALFFVQQAFSSSTPRSGSGTTGNIVDGSEQVIKMAVNNYQYEPSTLTVQAGKPVKWIIDGTNAVGCSSYLTSPQLGVNKRLSPGENIVQFTAPTQKGTYGFSCSMGMVKGTMNVV